MKKSEALQEINDLIKGEREDYEETYWRYKFMLKIKQDLKGLFHRGFTIDYAFRISKPYDNRDLPSIGLEISGKDFNVCENVVADLCIDWNFAVKRNVGGVWSDSYPRCHFDSHTSVVLPKSQEKVLLRLTTKHLPENCHVSVARHRTWSTQARYSTYCAV